MASTKTPKRKKLIVIVILVLSDFTLYIVALLAGIFVQIAIRGLEIDNYATFWLYLSTFILVFFAFAFSNLYPGYGLTGVKETEIIIKGISLVNVLIGFTLIFLQVQNQISGFVLLFSWLISIIFIPIARIMLRNRLSLLSLYGENVIVMGDGAVKTVIDLIHCRRLGWIPIGTFQQEGENHLGGINIPIINSKDELIDFGRNNEIKIVIFGSSSEFNKNPLSDELWIWLSETFNKIIVIFSDHISGSVGVNTRDLEGSLGLEFHVNLFNFRARLVKRMFDIVITTALIIFLLPLMLIIALLVKFDSPGPIIFRHKRIGEKNNHFNLFKFRTMIQEAEKKLHEYLENNHELKEEMKTYQKLKYDPRITRIGKLLRKFSLDELPQFWNVLRGDMSLIGPRAITPQEVVNYGHYSSIILGVRPGISGWWQVMGRNNVDWKKRTSMELYYVSNWSFWLEYYIFLKTIWAIVLGQGN